ncbi:MAG: amidohydrolase/deacetylase family metallohydrolase [Gemmatimonadetes bacterium]|jgi:dihydroorotase|nr:amidohydrolase/deacetylase family metallohydrolase [Gemmatimonadota bacterium]
MSFDLLLKGGHLIDPKNGLDGPMDLAITRGKVAAVDREIPSEQARKVLDVSGLYVTPGLVDIHSHMYATPGHRRAWAGDNSILPDGFSFRSGVTTMVDTGSAGWRNFEDFRFRVIDRFQTRKFAFLNIVGLGMVANDIEQNVHDMSVERAVAVCRENADVIVGMKTAHYYAPDWTSVDLALAAGKELGLPTMVDFGFFCKERPYYKLVTERMGAGDITTHMYLAAIPWVGPDGKVPNFFYEARKRGVIFDVGHGAGSFVFRNAVPSIEQGFYPDSISTDLHTLSMNAEMMDMTTVMSKFLAMGMPLEEIVRESTINPAMEINHSELGHLTVGAVADVAVLGAQQGNFGYIDVAGGRLRGKERLICEMTLKDGEVVWDWNGRTGTDYGELGLTYGLRDVDQLILPES